MEPSSPPLVTLAFPLYRSMRFFDYIVDNIERATYPNLEILISDRHLFDDAVEQLKAHFAGDPRIRYLTATDEIDWIQHWNLLLKEGTGKYHLWVSHDDSIEDGYIEALVEHLEATPEAVIAYGTRKPVSIDGGRVWVWEPPPPTPEVPWTVRTAMRLHLLWDIGSSFHGVYRRDRLFAAGITIPSTTRLAFADLYWMVGVSMLGRCDYVPQATFIKRAYATSTSALWNKPTPFMESTRMASAYIARYAPSVDARVTGVALVWFAAGLHFIRGQVNRLAGRDLITLQGVRRVLRLFVG